MSKWTDELAHDREQLRQQGLNLKEEAVKYTIPNVEHSLLTSAAVYTIGAVLLKHLEGLHERLNETERRLRR